jgi:hypothetical protein
MSGNHQKAATAKLQTQLTLGRERWRSTFERDTWKVISQGSPPSPFSLQLSLQSTLLKYDHARAESKLDYTHISKLANTVQAQKDRMTQRSI